MTSAKREHTPSMFYNSSVVQALVRPRFIDPLDYPDSKVGKLSAVIIGKEISSATPVRRLSHQERIPPIESYIQSQSKDS